VYMMNVIPETRRPH